MTIGQRIEYILEKRGKKKIDLARDLDISTASVSTMCSGKTNPSKQTIDQICTKYGVSKEWLTEEKGQPFAPQTLAEEAGQIAREANTADPEEAYKFFYNLIDGLTEAEIVTMYTIFKRWKERQTQPHKE